MRLTSQRQQTLECLVGLPRHFGAEELMMAVEARLGPSAPSRATQYRFLAELEALGVLRRVALSEGHSHYEFAFAADRHVHLVCLRCGSIEEINSPALTRAVGRLCRERGLAPEDVEVEITATCRACRG